MNLVSSPALRPSLPHGCRKRPFGQGHALLGHFVGLDLHALASGHKYSRATDEEASGGGSVKGSSQPRYAKIATRQRGSHFSRLAFIPTRDGRDTCKPAPAYTPQRSPHTCSVTAGQTSRCPRRRAHHADHAVCQMRIGRLPHAAQAFAAYRFPVSGMLALSRCHTDQRHAGYDPAAHQIHTRRDPDACIMRLWLRTDTCSFVLPYLRGPAYVSPIRCEYSLTAGEGRCPFDPRKAKRQGKR